MKKISAALVAVLTLLLLVLPVSANSPPPDHTYVFYFENLPEGTAYVDLLIKLPTDDPQYTPLETKNLPQGIAETAPIVTYCQDDYRSFSLHYKDALTAFRVSRDSTVSFFARNSYGQMEDVVDRGKVKLAMLDEAGNILQVSKPVALDSNGVFTSVIRQVHYDAKTDRGKLQTEFDPLAFIAFLMMSAVGLAFTCVVEWAAAWPFGLDKKHSRIIFLTNALSQLIMRLVDVLIKGLVDFDYVYMLLILEIPVYLCEFLVYRRNMKDVSWKRCLFYTVTANTLSLLLGLYVFRLVLT